MRKMGGTLCASAMVLAAAAAMRAEPVKDAAGARAEVQKMFGFVPDFDREISEALAMAGHVRNWSTLMNGLQVDKATFKRDVDKLVKAAKKGMPATASR